MFRFGASVVSPMICACAWFSIMIVYTCLSDAVAPPSTTTAASGVAPSWVAASETVTSAAAAASATGAGFGGEVVAISTGQEQAGRRNRGSGEKGHGGTHSHWKPPDRHCSDE